MADSESVPDTPVHPNMGGKSLALVERPPYKSWRKKYRKMRTKFNVALEENRRLFKEEQKLEGIARRLKEELDGLLELCLDLNQNPALPPELRFDISLPKEHTTIASLPSVVQSNITPEAANEMLMQYTLAVQRGQIPHMDLHVLREQIEKTLAAQDTETLEKLEARVPHAIPVGGRDELPEEIRGDEPIGLLTTEQEDAYLQRLNAKDGDPLRLTRTQDQQKDTTAGQTDDKHWAEMPPREVERLIELHNPQSQHNWIKKHAKAAGGLLGAADMDDAEYLASPESKPARGGSKRNLAKQVGDRALERAREGFSPSAASAGFGDEDELSFVDDHPSSAKKRGRGDVDGTYRVKGGKNSGGASTKGKRKRPSGEDGTVSKRVKTDVGAD